MSPGSIRGVNNRFVYKALCVVSATFYPTANNATGLGSMEVAIWMQESLAKHGVGKLKREVYTNVTSDSAERKAMMSLAWHLDEKIFRQASTLIISLSESAETVLKATFVDKKWVSEQAIAHGLKLLSGAARDLGCNLEDEVKNPRNWMGNQRRSDARRNPTANSGKQACGAPLTSAQNARLKRLWAGLTPKGPSGRRRATYSTRGQKQSSKRE